MPMYRCRGSRGSTLIECSVAPPGGPCSCSPPIQTVRMGLALKPVTPSQVTPPSSERNNPGGETPAYQAPGSEECPGVSQNTCSTARPFSPAAALGNAGGRCASFQVRPKSVERNTVGPRWPARTAQSSVLPSRGSSTRGLTMLPRKWGPASVQLLRARSDFMRNTPLRVPTSSVTGPEAGRGVPFAALAFGMSTSLCFQSFDPAPVKARGDRVERMHPLVEPLEHLLRGLHRRRGFRNELFFPVFAPGADQLGRHLDMALHAEVLAEHERLVRAIRTPGDARRLRRDGEGLAVPVKPGELPHPAEPLARASVVFDRDRAPADFLYPVARHPATERFGDELSAEAVAEHRNIGVDCLPYQSQHPRD